MPQVAFVTYGRGKYEYSAEIVGVYEDDCPQLYTDIFLSLRELRFLDSDDGLSDSIQDAEEEAWKTRLCDIQSRLAAGDLPKTLKHLEEFVLCLGDSYQGEAWNYAIESHELQKSSAAVAGADDKPGAEGDEGAAVEAK